MKKEYTQTAPAAKAGDILVATWGYSMLLTTWVRVVAAAPKTILVEEIDGRSLTVEELAERKLESGYGQPWVVASDKRTERNGKQKPKVRLYRRDDSTRGRENEPVATYIGNPDGMGSKLYFHIWDGRAIQEDHND